MDENALQLLIAMYDNESGAEDNIGVIQAARKEGQRGIQAAVAIVKDKDSQIHYKDVGLTPAKGAAGGAVLGAALGILSGGVGFALGALGAVVGSLIGSKKSAGQFTSVSLNEVVASLVPGSSAIVAIVDKEHLADIESRLDQSRAEVFSTELSADLAEQLQAHSQTDHTEWMDQLSG